MSKLIAVSHPGKSGDLIYSVPAAKWLCEHFQTKCHFYISDYYKWLQRLLNYQDHFIEECIIAPGYEIDHHAWGAQPWNMSPYIPVDNYAGLYQFGYKNFPDRPLPDFGLSECGFEGITPKFVGTFKYPEIETLDTDYVCSAFRLDPAFEASWRSFADQCPLPIVQIGMEGEGWNHPNSIDISGVDWLETVSWLSKAKGFFGRISSQAGLAHSFDMPKVCLYHDGWDMRHVVRTPTTLYQYQPHVNRHGDIPINGKLALEFMGLT